MQNPAGGGRAPIIIALLAGAILVAGTIGPPLVGRGVFLASDLVYSVYPWRADAGSDHADALGHGPVGDTVDATYPARATFGADLKHGDLVGWNPTIAGGQTTTTSGSLNPLAWPFILLPTWFAPAVVKLLDMLAAGGFTYLFCRRLRLDRVPAVLAGMAFAGSGFMVMWTNWPQPDVAATIPALFWATERFVQRKTAAAAVPLALATAAMLLGAFPAVVGYALYVLVPYGAVRLLLEHRKDLRQGLTLAATAGTALVAGVMLAAFDLLPFLARLGLTDYDYRAQHPDANLGSATLLTALAPGAFGLSSQGQAYYGPINQIEAISFIGVTTALLALVAVALGPPRRTPGGAFSVLAWATLVLGTATFAGGPLLGLLQKLPVFSNNFIGRSRSVLGFTVAVLAALGLQALLDRSEPMSRRRRLRLAGAAAATAALAGFVAWRSAQLTRAVGSVAVLRHALIVPVGVGVVALAAALALWFGPARPPWLRQAAVAVLPAALVVEALALALPLLPNESRDTLYPDTAAAEFLQDHLGDDRVAVEGLIFYGNSVAFWDLRIPTGHAFYTREWKDLLLAADPTAFRASPSLPFLGATPEVMTAPALDRLGATWFATNPQAPPLGRRGRATLGQGTCDRDRPGADHGTIPAGGGLRGVVVRVCDDTALPEGAELVITADAGGRTITSHRPLATAVEAGELRLPVPGDGIDARQGVDVTVSLAGAGDARLPLATAPEGLALDPIRPAGDGLRLAYADDLLVYQRTRGLPRIHWAGRSQVIEDADRRIRQLADGSIPRDTVVLDTGTPSAGPASRASVEVAVDEPERLEMAVDAGGAGHLVIADAMQADWVATVDGRHADLVDADHAGVAVAVPAGRHEVVIRYAPRRRTLGLALSAVAALGLAAAAATATPWFRRRRRRRRSASGEVPG